MATAFIMAMLVMLQLFRRITVIGSILWSCHDEGDEENQCGAVVEDGTDDASIRTKLRSMMIMMMIMMMMMMMIVRGQMAVRIFLRG